mmetsp:Transcript_37735/g.94634  ORF Transcript_37735/g.94634 Transcript_37735/m.94634 type:complete len:93 (-) Transcript_37735:221-499(-)
MLRCVIHTMCACMREWVCGTHLAPYPGLCVMMTHKLMTHVQIESVAATLPPTTHLLPLAVTATFTLVDLLSELMQPGGRCTTLSSEATPRRD